jgi:segregation and condensation protein B
MSLKAKLEAVIYAAEEPVTLAQLAVLFTADALEWKAEEEAARAEQATLGDAAEPLRLESGEFDYLEPDPSAASPQPDAEPAVEPALAPEAGVASDASPSSGEAETEAPEPELAVESPVDEESDLKRISRQRDRDVRAILRQLLDELIAECASDNRGVEIREIAGGYRMATKPECHDAVRSFVKSLKPALKLSLPALETLAVIAYKQPVTAPEVNEIRGVDSSGVFGSLLARKLIATAGRKPVIGRPILYKTTKEFLLRFGLKDVSELPSMEEFEKMAAVELDEPEIASEPPHLPEHGTNPALDAVYEFDENASEASDEATDPGSAPESAETPAVQEIPVAAMPAPMPVVMTAQNRAEAPPVTAADPSAARPAPADAEAPEAN